MGAKIEKLAIPGAYVIQPDVFKDDRGYFTETYSLRTLKNGGFEPPVFVQENESYSKQKGTVRGIHFQRYPYCQAKLVRVSKGAVYDVLVDLRKDSPTYKKWIGVELSQENAKQLFIPQGCGHAFMALTEDVLFSYKVDNFYAPECDGGIRFDDPEIGIVWPIEATIRSEKDLKLPYLKDVDLNFHM